jgi:hypothetical protein
MKQWLTSAILSALPIVREYWSLAAGAAAGVILEYVQTALQNGGDLSQIDYRHMLRTSLAMALVALLHHWLPAPPNNPLAPLTPTDPTASRTHTSSDLLNPK